MPDTLISNHTAYVASLRGCPSCPDRLSALAGMRTLAAQTELRHAVSTHLATHFPQLFTLNGSLLTAQSDGNTLNLHDDSDDPLRQLSRIVQEDFMLIQEIDGRQTITAAANAYSSSGRLVASVGRNLRWAHEPVPHLSASLGLRIDRIIASVHENSPCARFNWQLTPLSSIFLPPDPHAANQAALKSVRARLQEDPALAGQLLNVRVERQTLRRLPATRAIAFSIHTYSDPLASIATDFSSVQSMLKLLRQYSGDRLRYTEMDGIQEAVVMWLERLVEQNA